ncbi:MAG: hypothetical protein ACRDT8_25755, partial [Micromonosporaceae bacterium]
MFSMSPDERARLLAAASQASSSANPAPPNNPSAPPPPPLPTRPPAGASPNFPTSTSSLRTPSPTPQVTEQVGEGNSPRRPVPALGSSFQPIGQHRASGAQRPDAGYIHGHVRKNGGGPVEGASLTLIDLAGGQIGRGATGADG